MNKSDLTLLTLQYGKPVTIEYIVDFYNRNKGVIEEVEIEGYISAQQPCPNGNFGPVRFYFHRDEALRGVYRYSGDTYYVTTLPEGKPGWRFVKIVNLPYNVHRTLTRIVHVIGGASS